MRAWAHWLLCLLLAAVVVGSRPAFHIDMDLAGWHCREALLPATAMLHVFSYNEGREEAVTVLDGSLACPMAAWVAAASHWHTLWRLPEVHEAEEALALVARGLAIVQTMQEENPASEVGADGGLQREVGDVRHEEAMLRALGHFYSVFLEEGYVPAVHAYESAMKQLHKRHPLEPEVGCQYALALNCMALACMEDSSLCDDDGEQWEAQHSRTIAGLMSGSERRTLFLALRAGRMLELIWLDHPRHPGVLHYLIHSYDYPALAAMAVPAAFQFHVAAPRVSHAHHMPAHIFDRRGLWKDAIEADLLAMEVVQSVLLPAALGEREVAAGSTLHDEFLHSLDYLVYSYLQLGRDECALQGVSAIYAASAVVLTDPPRGAAYSMVAAASRFAYETRQWHLVADLPLPEVGIDFENIFAENQALIFYARATGIFYSHLWDVAGRGEEGKRKEVLEKLLELQAKFGRRVVAEELTCGMLWKVTVEVQREIVRSCVLWVDGKVAESLEVLRDAADLEDRYEKPSVKPSVIMPAREQLATRLLWLAEAADTASESTDSGTSAVNLLEESLGHFSAVVARNPGRLVPTHGVARAAALLAGMEMAVDEVQRRNFTRIALDSYEKIASLAEDGAWQVAAMGVIGSFRSVANSALAVAPTACGARGSYRAALFEEAAEFIDVYHDGEARRRLTGKGLLVASWWAGVLLLCCGLLAGYSCARMHATAEKLAKSE